jgi:co-chaperonin GroES (HSP10)
MTNESGISPLEYKVLILPKEVTDVTAGGIVMPADVVEKEKYGNAYGTIIAHGAIAFTDPDWLDHPRVGDDVLFDKYAGTHTLGTDGKEYRLINDKEIVARMTKEKTDE